MPRNADNSPMGLNGLGPLDRPPRGLLPRPVKSPVGIRLASRVDGEAATFLIHRTSPRHRNPSRYSRTRAPHVRQQSGSLLCHPVMRDFSGDNLEFITLM